MPETTGDNARHKIRKDRADTLLVRIEDDVYSRQFAFEELPVEPVKWGFKRAFRVSGIPFLVYGINKGDIVAATGGTIKSVLRDDGQYGYRIAYPTFNSDKDAHVHIALVLRELNDSGFETEEFNHKISAANAVNADEAIRLETILSRLINDKQIIAFDTIR
jgi:hypothetical protein